MLTNQSYKCRFLCWLLNISQNVEANLSILKDYQRHHRKYNQLHAARVIKEHACNLRQEKAVSHQVLHIIYSGVWDHMNCHIKEVVKVADCIIVCIKLGPTPIEPSEKWPQ